MKRLLIFLAFLSVSSVIKSQQNFQDNVFLKNGSILRGTIIEQVLNKSVTIVRTEGDTLIISFDEIEKLTREPSSEKKKGPKFNLDLNPGYQLIIEGSLIYGMGKFGTNKKELSVINGIRLNREIAIGIGAGIGYYPKRYLSGSYDKQVKMVYPVFVDFRTGITVSKIASLYYSFDLGYTFAQKPEYNGVSGYYKDFGLFFNLKTGISLKNSEKMTVQFAIDYELQKRRYNGYYENLHRIYFNDINKLISSIGVITGITF